MFLCVFLLIRLEKLEFSLTKNIEKEIFVIVKCFFHDIHSKSDGGAINVHSEDFIGLVESNIFENCTSDGKAGALMARASSMVAKRNCFHFCRCGSGNGCDGSTLFALGKDEINLSLCSFHQCPKYGDSCWYGVSLLWNSEMNSNSINVSESHVQFIAGLAHCQPKAEKSSILFYNAVCVLDGNSLAFVNMDMAGSHKLGNIINNSVKSGLIYFQAAKTILVEFIFMFNKGSITYMSVSGSGIFKNCVFDTKIDPKGNGMNTAVDCLFETITNIPSYTYLNTAYCNGYAPFTMNIRPNNMLSIAITISLFLFIILSPESFDFIVPSKYSFMFPNSSTFRSRLMNNHLYVK